MAFKLQHFMAGSLRTAAYPNTRTHGLGSEPSPTQQLISSRREQTLSGKSRASSTSSDKLWDINKTTWSCPSRCALQYTSSDVYIGQRSPTFPLCLLSINASRPLAKVKINNGTPMRIKARMLSSGMRRIARMVAEKCGGSTSSYFNIRYLNHRRRKRK